MRVHGRLSGVGLGLAAGALVWALSVISPAAAGATPGASHRAAEPASSGVEMGLSQAPPSLRAAIQKTMGAPAQPAAKARQQAKLTGSDAVSGDQFGYSVALSKTTAVVGAPFHNSAAGAAYVYVRSGTTWSQQSELTASDAAPANEFGTSVAVAGSTVVVGSPANNSDTGAAYVFTRSGTTWSQQAELTASDAATINEFGFSVAVAGSTVVVGAPARGNLTGAVYVFTGSGMTWSQQAELTASDAATINAFGYSVSVSGSNVLVGAPFRNSSTGAAYVFTGSGPTWSQEAELTATDGASGDGYGKAVAVSGLTAVVGAYGHNSSTGAAYVYAGTGTAWSQQAELTARNGASDDNFGYSVAASSSTIVVGAFGHSSSTGAAYVFTRSGTTWSQQAKLTARNGVSGDEFGFSVSESRGSAVVGAPGRASGGAAYVFTLPA